MPGPFPSSGLFPASPWATEDLPQRGDRHHLDRPARAGQGGGGEGQRHSPAKIGRFFRRGTPCGGLAPAFIRMCVPFQTEFPFLPFQNRPSEKPPEERAGEPGKLRGNAALRGDPVKSSAKLTIELDANTTGRLEAERARIEAETGLPRVSMAGTVAAVLRRALPENDKADRSHA